MKILIQRVEFAKVFVNKNLISEINDGFLIFIGIEKGDEKKIERAVDKLLSVKIIEDEQGRFRFSLNEKKFPLLLISQITLLSSFKKNKPEFDLSPDKKEAEEIFKKFEKLLKEKGFQVETGIFGEYMEIENKNLGPVSFIIEI